MRHIALCDLLAGRPVGEDGDVVTQSPAGTAGGVVSALTQTPVVPMGAHLWTETNRKQSEQTKKVT